MQMRDAAHVPCQDRDGGVRRFVWDLAYGRILIDVHPDGRVEVNGGVVAPAAGAVPSDRPGEPSR